MLNGCGRISTAVRVRVEHAKRSTSFIKMTACRSRPRGTCPFSCADSRSVTRPADPRSLAAARHQYKRRNVNDTLLARARQRLGALAPLEPALYALWAAALTLLCACRFYSSMRLQTAYADLFRDPLHAFELATGGARTVVSAARRRLHSFRFCASSGARAPVRVVARRWLFERRYELALSVRARAGLLVEPRWAQLDVVGGDRRVRVRVRIAARAAPLLERSAARHQLPVAAGAAERRRARLVAVERHGSGAVSRVVVARCGRVGRLAARGSEPGVVR